MRILFGESFLEDRRSCYADSWSEDLDMRILLWRILFGGS